MISEIMSLLLACEGGIYATAPSESGSVILRDNKGNAVYGNSATRRSTFISATVTFELKGEQARLNIPGSLLQGNERQGDAGWFAVNRLAVSDLEIKGSVRLGLLKTSNFRIDRITGKMTSDGGYEGVCEPLDEAKRKF